MPNENESERPSPDAVNKSFVRSNVSPLAAEQQEMRKQGGADKNKSIEIEKDIRNGDRWLIGIILSAVIALIYFGQLKEMRKATRASKRAADAAAKAADIANKTLEEIRVGGTDTHELAVQAKAANLQNGEVFKAENRPWLSFEVVSLAPDPKGVVSVQMRNFGKTPATNATDVDARTRVANGPEEEKALWDKLKEEKFEPRKNPTDVIAPDEIRTMKSTPDGTYSPRSDVSQTVVVIGRVDYSGAYAKAEHYWTEFCFAYDPRRYDPVTHASPWSTCVPHNVMK